MKISWAVLLAAAAETVAQLSTVTVTLVETRSTTTAAVETLQPIIPAFSAKPISFEGLATDTSTISYDVDSSLSFTSTHYLTKWRTLDVHKTRTIIDMQDFETTTSFYRTLGFTSVVANSTTRVLYVPYGKSTPTAVADVTTTSLSVDPAAYMGKPLLVVLENLVVDVNYASSATYTWDGTANYAQEHTSWMVDRASETAVVFGGWGVPVVTKTRIMIETRYWAHQVVTSGSGTARTTYTQRASDYALAPTLPYLQDSTAHIDNHEWASAGDIDEYTDPVVDTASQIDAFLARLATQRTHQTHAMVGTLGALVPCLALATVLLVGQRIRASDVRARRVYDRRRAEAAVEAAQMQAAQRVADEADEAEARERERRHRELVTVRAEERGVWDEAPPSYAGRVEDQVVTDIELAELRRDGNEGGESK